MTLTGYLMGYDESATGDIHGADLPVVGQALSSSIAIGTCYVRNRIGFGPVNPGIDGTANRATDPVEQFYSELALSGVGLAYIGGVAISSGGRSNRSSLVAPSRDASGFIARVVDDSAAAGMAIVVQLMHSGRQASMVEIGQRPVAASPLPCPYYRETPAEASLEDIAEIVKAFAASAKIVADVGCKIIEIHAAHGYFLSGFLSRNTNHRTDGYGGSLRNRFRILQEVMEAVRSDTSVSVGFRVNVFEDGPSGLRVDELIDGLDGLDIPIDFLSVSGGMYAADPRDDWIIPRRSRGSALWRRQARMMRHNLGLPIFIAGNIDDGDLADEIVRSGDADVALMVRSLLADPLLYKKYLDSDLGEVQRCTEFYLCKYHSRGADHVFCPHNGLLRRGFRPRVDRTFTLRKSSDR